MDRKGCRRRKEKRATPASNKLEVILTCLTSLFTLSLIVEVLSSCEQKSLEAVKKGNSEVELGFSPSRVTFGEVIIASSSEEYHLQSKD